MTKPIEIYQTDQQTIEVRFDSEQETVCLTQRQMGELFGTTSENVLMHLENIYKYQELEGDSTSKKFLVVQTEGKRQLERNLLH